KRMPGCRVTSGWWGGRVDVPFARRAGAPPAARVPPRCSLRERPHALDFVRETCPRWAWVGALRAEKCSSHGWNATIRPRLVQISARSAVEWDAVGMEAEERTARWPWVLALIAVSIVAFLSVGAQSGYCLDADPGSGAE